MPNSALFLSFHLDLHGVVEDEDTAKDRPVKQAVDAELREAEKKLEDTMNDVNARFSPDHADFPLFNHDDK